jgi:hypothetical protein
MSGLAGGGCRPAGRRGRGRSHPGRRRAEGVVTWPGARTLTTPRRRRPWAAARPRSATLAALMLATALLATLMLAALVLAALVAALVLAALVLAALELAAALLTSSAGLGDLRHGRPRRCRARFAGRGRPARRPARCARPRGPGCRPSRARCLRHWPGPRCGRGTLRGRRGGRGGPGRFGTAARAATRRHTRSRAARGGTARRRDTGRRGGRDSGRRSARPARAAITAAVLPVAELPVTGRGTWPSRTALRRGGAPPALALSLLAPIGAESFLEPAHDGRLDRRGRRTNELAHFLELDHDGLALYAELFREFVYPDLRHYAPLLGPDSRTIYPDHHTSPGQRVLRAGVSLWSSSPCAHRALIAVSTRFPDRLPFLPSLCPVRLLRRTGGRDVPWGERPEPVRPWLPTLMLCLP